MVSLKNYYNNVKVSEIPSTPLGIRVRRILDDLITRLPDEEQFGIKGQINFFPRLDAIKFWNIHTQLRYGPDMYIHMDGSCTLKFSDHIENSFFSIMIIIDDLDNRSDGYITGLIAHEISEMSYSWKIRQEWMPKLKKLKPKARLIRLNQLIGQNAPVGSLEHDRHERNVNAEARRLGFSNEILALENERSVNPGLVF